MFKMLTKRDWVLLVLIAILFGCAVNSVFYKYLTPSDLEILWTGKLSAWNDVALSFIAAMLWWYGLRTRYESGLPSIATIEFIYNGKAIMRCIDSNLPDVAAAREFAQSLGRELLKLKYSKKQDSQQSSMPSEATAQSDQPHTPGCHVVKPPRKQDQYHLDMMLPTVSVKKLGIKRDHVLPNGEKSDCMDHKITITLTEPHDKILKDPEIFYDDGKSTGKCLTWRAPFLQIETL